MGRTSWISGFRRTVAAGVATVVAAAVVASTAGATVATAPADPYVDPGEAHGSATVVNIAPATGSLAFAVNSGSAIAQTRGSLAESQAQSMDFGLIGSSLTAEQCDGDDPVVQPEQLPQPTRADNRQGEQASESTEYPLAGASLGSGHERATATMTPSAEAAVTSVNLDLGPALQVAGGRAGALSEVIPGAGRQATTTVEATLRLAGVLEMTAVRWTARHRTGSEQVTEGRFEIGALEVLGVPLPVDDLGRVQQAINDALAPTGLRLELPVVEHLTEPVDIVRVTPLRILIDNSPVGATVLRPGLDLSREVRSALFEALVEIECRLGNILLVGEIGIGVASGTGALAIEIGGVSARSADVVYEDPFGSLGPLLSTGTGEALALDSGEPAGLPPAVAVVGPPSAPSAAVEVAAALPVEARCESLHPLRRSGCSQGAAAAVGAVGIVATLAVGCVDYRRRRREVMEVEP